MTKGFYMTFENAKEKLEKYGQAHLLKYYDELSEEDKKDLLEQIEVTDFSVLTAKAFENEDNKITPIKALTVAEIEKEKEEDKKIGLEYIRAGKVGLLLLAGGMGTRLGSDNPKGMYNIGITKELCIFECQMNNIMDVVKEAGAYPYLFIMTSPKNDAKTRAFFKEKNYFGYEADKVKFFVQSMAPIVDMNNNVLLENKHQIALSPNGNGGWFSSLVNAGLLPLVEETGIEIFNIYAVDNVLQRIGDPVFIGATVRRNMLCGAKVIKKAYPEEGLGVMCYLNDQPSVVEYYELSDELRYAKGEDGEYLYYFGVILNYLFNVKKLKEILDAEFPMHKAFKKVAYLNENGETVTPTEPNAYKFETLATDMVKLMETCLPFECVREKEFAPVKNLTGKDSVDSARELLKLNGVEL